jgi:hypothetical protein
MEFPFSKKSSQKIKRKVNNAGKPTLFSPLHLFYKKHPVFSRIPDDKYACAWVVIFTHKVQKKV